MTIDGIMTRDNRTRCNDKRLCFAKSRNGECSILRPIPNKDYAYKNDGDCPFCKPHINDRL